MGNKKEKKSPLKAFGIIFIVILILTSLFVIGVHIAFKNKNVTPSIAGYSLYLMDDDYMEPKIPRHSLILATNGTPTTEQIGKAVVVDDVAGYGTTVMRLVDITTENGKLYYKLKFDRSTDTVTSKGKKIVGIAEYSDKISGRMINLAKSTFGLFVLIGIPAFFAILFLALNAHKKKLAKQETVRKRDEYRKLREQEDYVDDLNNPVTFDEFVHEKEELEPEMQPAPEPIIASEPLNAEILDEPLIEEGIKKDELVEIKENMNNTQSTNTAIEELMKILEEENAKLKSLELPSEDELESSDTFAQDKTEANEESPKEQAENIEKTEEN